MFIAFQREREKEKKIYEKDSNKLWVFLKSASTKEEVRKRFGRAWPSFATFFPGISGYSRPPRPHRMQFLFWSVIVE
jgi:hypothetical protein